MWPDVIDLRDFYDTSLGHVAQRSIRSRVRALWPNVRGLNVMGLGYASPYLRPFREEAERVVVMMPERMGVVTWPPEGPNAAGIASEAGLPLPDLSMDRILLVHALECSSELQACLREVWRVLADSGRLMAIVPNRRGIWARLDHTPFGHGQPYSTEQLHRILRDAMFAPMRTVRALYMPPSRRRFLLTSAPAWDKVGDRWLQPLAGVVMVEATKQIYAGSQVRVRAARKALPASSVLGSSRSQRIQPGRCAKLRDME